jgi:UDP-glucose 4-epimerase
MWQFVDENDMANAILLALEGKKSGIYNVVGEGVIPLSHAIRLAGGNPVPVPQFLSGAVIAGMKFLGQNFPKHLVDFFKYPVVISDKNFRKDFGYTPLKNTADALRALKVEPTPEIPGSKRDST